MRRQEGFSTEDVAHLTRVSERTLGNWEHVGFLRASIPAPRRGVTRRYSFRDIIAIKVASLLRETGTELQTLRPIVDYIRSREGLSVREQLSRTTLVVTNGEFREEHGEVISMPCDEPIATMVHIIPLHRIVEAVQREARELVLRGLDAA